MPEELSVLEMQENDTGIAVLLQPYEVTILPTCRRWRLLPRLHIPSQPTLLKRVETPASGELATVAVHLLHRRESGGASE